MTTLPITHKPSAADERAGKVLQHIQQQTRQGIAVTAMQLTMLGLSQEEVKEALSFLLHSDLPMVAITIQRNSTGAWKEHYFAPVTPGAIPHACDRIPEARREQHTKAAWPFPRARDH